MDSAALNNEFGIPETLHFAPGPGGLEMLYIRNAAASARISLYAGQVLSYRPTDQPHDLLFLSEHAYYAAGKAIKGGIPICWPWFGTDPQQPGRPAHGFARTSPWEIESSEAASDRLTRVTLRLASSAAAGLHWPHSLQLRLVVAVGETLSIELQSTNTGSGPVQLTQALHTYFAVGDIDQVSILGLEGLRYLDKAAGGTTGHDQQALRIATEVDRIYAGVVQPLTIDDPAWGRQIRIEARGSHTAVVWNPWESIARSMADLDDLDYRRLLCVETANAADEIISLDAGASHRLCASYRILRA